MARFAEERFNKKCQDDIQRRIADHVSSEMGPEMDRRMDESKRR